MDGSGLRWRAVEIGNGQGNGQEQQHSRDAPTQPPVTFLYSCASLCCRSSFSRPGQRLKIKRHIADGLKPLCRVFHQTMPQHAL